MKRIFCALLALTLLFGLCACSAVGTKYVSSYGALGLVRTNGKDQCSAKFHKLKGTCVLKIKSTEDGEGELHYTASLESGEINVYYDANGTKELLFHLSAGESVDENGGYFDGKGTIYVIIETVESAKGNVSVELNG